MSGRKLPVLATVVQGWKFMAGDWSVLLRISCLPLGILVVVDFLISEAQSGQLGGSIYTNPENTSDPIAVLWNLQAALLLVSGGLIVALWHRVRLTGRQVLSIFGLLSAWRNIMTLTVYWCALILVTIGLKWIFSAPLGPPANDILNEILVQKFGLIAYPALYRVLMDLVQIGVPLFAAFYISGRLGLLLWTRPAGGEGALDKAWAAGNGNGWRIAAAIFLATAPVMIVASALQPMASGANSIFFMFLLLDLQDLLRLVIAASVISAVHQALLGDEIPADAIRSTNEKEG